MEEYNEVSHVNKIYRKINKLLQVVFIYLNSDKMDDSLLEHFHHSTIFQLNVWMLYPMLPFPDESLHLAQNSKPSKRKEERILPSKIDFIS